MMMSEKNAFGSFVARKRREAALTQRDLAETLFVTESAVSKWERGVSYPDISLLAPLCAALRVTEHELLTAGEDLAHRRLERQATAFRRIKYAWQWVFYLAYGVALLVCFIVNLAVDRTLSWFWVVLSSLTLSFTVTSLPTLLERRRWLWTLAAFFAALQALLGVACLYTGGVWYPVAAAGVSLGFGVTFLPLVLRGLPLRRPWSRHKALLCIGADTALLAGLLPLALVYEGTLCRLPQALAIAGVSATLPWALVLLCRYVPLRRLHRASLCLTAAAVYAYTINSVLRLLIDGERFTLPAPDFLNWSSDAIINANSYCLMALTCLLLAGIFAIAGAAKRRK